MKTNDYLAMGEEIRVEGRHGEFSGMLRIYRRATRYWQLVDQPWEHVETVVIIEPWRKGDVREASGDQHLFWE